MKWHLAIVLSVMDVSCFGQWNFLAIFVWDVYRKMSADMELECGIRCPTAPRPRARLPHESTYQQSAREISRLSMMQATPLAERIYHISLENCEDTNVRAQFAVP